MSLWMKSYGVTIQMKATEQYFPVVLFIMQYKVVLTFASVTRHSHEVLKGHRLLWSVLYLSHLRLYSPHRLLTLICQTNKLRSLSPNY